MKVFLDGECLQESAASLEDALAAANTRAEQRGRLILEILADGSPLPGESLDQPQDHREPISELAMISADPVAFARNILHEAVDALQQAKERQRVAIDLLEQGIATEAFEHLGYGLQLWDMVQQVVSRTSNIAPPADDAQREHIDAQVILLRDRLGELRDAVGQEDWAGLGDLVRYDLTELAESWSVMLRTWADGLGLAGEG
jgi:hypothetical protein